MIKILHLYHDILNLYGEYANITVLCDLLEKNNVKYSLDKFTIGDSFDFNSYDFIYCGSGTENKIKYALNDFIKRKDSFLEAVHNNKHILFTGSSFALLGNKLDNIDASGIFGYDTIQAKTRFSGDVIASCFNHSNIIGFLNTSYLVNTDSNPYYQIDYCDDIIKQFSYIGYRRNNLITINLVGPLLVRNPELLKEYVNELGLIEKEDFNYIDLISDNQYKAYFVALDELTKRFN